MDWQRVLFFAWNQPLFADIHPLEQAEEGTCIGKGIRIHSIHEVSEQRNTQHNSSKTVIYNEPPSVEFNLVHSAFLTDVLTN